MTWEEFYDRFYNWAESTQKSRISSLTDFGSSDEICEIAESFIDDKAASRLIRKALDAGVLFSPDEIKELLDLVSEEMYTDLIRANATPYTEEDLDHFYGLVDDDLIVSLAQNNGINYWLCEESQETAPRKKGLGFFTTLFGILGISSLVRGKETPHNGRCDGNCANCPPHYGYRYGRWYYGHDHIHGCEFGGNRGSGSID